MKQNEVLEDFVKMSKMIEEKDQELALCKKALELACKEMEANTRGATHAWLQIQKIKNKFGIGDYKPYYDVFLQKAKEEIENGNKN